MIHGQEVKKPVPTLPCNFSHQFNHSFLAWSMWEKRRKKRPGETHTHERRALFSFFIGTKTAYESMWQPGRRPKEWLEWPGIWTLSLLLPWFLTLPPSPQHQSSQQALLNTKVFAPPQHLCSPASTTTQPSSTTNPNPNPKTLRVRLQQASASWFHERLRSGLKEQLRVLKHRFSEKRVLSLSCLQHAQQHNPVLLTLILGLWV